MAARPTHVQRQGVHLRLLELPGELTERVVREVRRPVVLRRRLVRLAQSAWFANDRRSTRRRIVGRGRCTPDAENLTSGSSFRIIV